MASAYFHIILHYPWPIILTLIVNISVPLYIHGSSDAHFYDLRDTHQCCVYTNISVPFLGFHIIVIRLLAAGPRGCCGW